MEILRKTGNESRKKSFPAMMKKSATKQRPPAMNYWVTDRILSDFLAPHYDIVTLTWHDTLVHKVSTSKVSAFCVTVEKYKENATCFVAANTFGKRIKRAH